MQSEDSPTSKYSRTTDYSTDRYTAGSTRTAREEASKNPTTPERYVPRSERIRDEPVTSKYSSRITETTTERERYVPRSERTATREEPTISKYSSRATETRDKPSQLGMDRVREAREGPKPVEVSAAVKYSGLVERQTNRTYTTRLDDRPVAGASRTRGFKPKAQKDHERQLESVTKGFNDMKKTVERDTERKGREYDRLWKEDERRMKENERREEQWQKKVERDTKETQRQFAEVQRQMNDKEELRAQREQEQEKRFQERVENQIANNLVKKEQKHDRWGQKMNKRLARNELLEAKRENRLNNRAKAKEERLENERKDAFQRRNRRREHFLLSYQSSWDESKINNDYDGENFVAPEVKKLKIPRFAKGDNRNTDEAGVAIPASQQKKSAIDAEIEEEERLLNAVTLDEGEDDTDRLMREMMEEEEQVSKPAATEHEETEDEKIAREMAELEAEEAALTKAAVADDEPEPEADDEEDEDAKLAREMAELEAEEAALAKAAGEIDDDEPEPEAEETEEEKLAREMAELEAEEAALAAMEDN